MKQHFPLLLIALLLLSSLSYAQTNYKEGLVVTTSGDTLHGFIDYREWDLSPTKVSFRTSANSGTVQEFTPANSRYFEVKDLESFQTYEGPITMGKVDKDNLWYNRADTTVVIGKIFLQEHQEGPHVTLYSYKDNIKERFFILEKGKDKPQELLFRRYYQSTGNAKIITQQYYVGQLLNVARQQGILTDKLQREIETAAYKEPDLIKIVSRINGQSDEEIAQQKGGKVGTRMFVGLGLNRGIVRIYGADPFTEANENPASYMPRLGFGMDVFLNKNVQQLILRFEAVLTNASYHLQRKEQSGSGYYLELYNMTQQTASITPQILYNLYNKDNFKLHIGGGLAINYSNYSKNWYSIQYFNPKYNVVHTRYERDPYKDLESVWGSYMIRTGVVLYKKYEISAMYMAPGTITRYGSREIATGSTSLSVNYLFQ